MQNMRSPGYCDPEWQSFRLEGPPKKIILEGPGARINITTSLDQADGRVRNIFGHFPPASTSINNNHHGASTDTNGVIKDVSLVRSARQPPHSKAMLFSLIIITRGEKSINRTEL